MVAHQIGGDVGQLKLLLDERLPDGAAEPVRQHLESCDDLVQSACREVLAATGVAITPGIDFGSHRAHEHVRFAYTIAMEKLEDGVDRLARHLPSPPRSP